MSPVVEHIMGMPITIDAADADRAVVDAAFEWLRFVDETFSTYRDDSQISRLDRGELRLADCHPEVDEVLTRCVRLREQTRGYFSVRAAGRLDPSGLVKGWAVARAAERLGAGGARRFSIDAGGDIVVRGDGWRIGIRHPLERDKLAAVLELSDVAIATSGEYERGQHVIDPHTGLPPSGLLSVTIVGPELAVADAYATAAFAMGAAGPAWAAARDGYETLCITSDREVLSSPGLDRYRR